MMDDLNNDCCILSPRFGKERLDMLAFILTFYLMSEAQDRNKEKEKNDEHCNRDN